MRIILVRHGDPDYISGHLTEKGLREAKLVGERAKSWVGQVDGIYVSPLLRARETAAPIEEALGMKAVVLPWLEEFRGRIDEKYGTHHCLAWDFRPEQWTAMEELYDRHGWMDAPVMEYSEGKPFVSEIFKETKEGLDTLLAAYGVIREKEYYRYAEPDMAAYEKLYAGCNHPQVIQSAEEARRFRDAWPVYEDRSLPHKKTIVLVCHMAISFVMLGYILGISFTPLIQGMFIPPTGVTVLNSQNVMSRDEMRKPAIGDTVGFRAQYIGDVRHLVKAGEPLSGVGDFGTIFQD